MSKLDPATGKHLHPFTAPLLFLSVITATTVLTILAAIMHRNSESERATAVADDRTKARHRMVQGLRRLLSWGGSAQSLPNG